MILLYFQFQFFCSRRRSLCYAIVSTRLASPRSRFHFAFGIRILSFVSQKFVCNSKGYSSQSVSSRLAYVHTEEMMMVMVMRPPPLQQAAGSRQRHHHPCHDEGDPTPLLGLALRSSGRQGRVLPYHSWWTLFNSFCQHKIV